MSIEEEYIRRIEALEQDVARLKSAMLDMGVPIKETKTPPVVKPSDDIQDAYDELLSAAVDVFLETGQVSVSILQRRLKLSYTRAVRLVAQLEEKGIVGPFEGSSPRKILITKAQWKKWRDGWIS